MLDAYIFAGLRTPFGRHGGALASVRPDDLAAHVIHELLARHAIPGEAIEDVILGNTNQAGEDSRNIARHAALLAGLPVTVPGQTVNRLCASGLAAVIDAARDAQTDAGLQQTVLVESVAGMETLKSIAGERRLLGKWQSLSRIGSQSHLRLRQISSKAVALATSFPLQATLALAHERLRDASC